MSPILCLGLYGSFLRKLDRMVILHFILNFLIPFFEEILKQLERNILPNIFMEFLKIRKKIEKKSLPDEGIEPGSPNGIQRET